MSLGKWRGMSPDRFYRHIVRPGLAFLREVTGVPSDERAHVLLMAIAGQESGWAARYQAGGGPAVSFFQFERLGGVKGVHSHAASRVEIQALCAALSLPGTVDSIYRDMATCDLLAVAMARLLLRTDPRALSAADDAEGGWSTYIRNWRPGKPHPDTWGARHALSLEIVRRVGGPFNT